MCNRIIFNICLLALISLNLSFTWPLENGRITSTFGESRGDHFHNGIDIISGSTKVRPVESGELVFFWDNSLFPTENYPGVGNYKILKHDSGYYSIYMHLSDNPDFRKDYSMNDPVGEISDTGHSAGKHLHLVAFQTASKKFINPFSVFPGIQDKTKPNIEDVYVRIEETYFRIKDKESIRLTQNYPLLVNIWDSISKVERLGIHKLVMVLNGEKVVDNDYSEISFQDSKLTVSGKSFDELYDEKGYYKASKVKYIDGVNELSITATDFSGNESSKKILFSVKLETQN